MQKKATKICICAKKAVNLQAEICKRRNLYAKMHTLLE